MGQPVQIAGAVALLIAFVLAQMGMLTQRSRWYLVLNLIGSAVLSVDAYLGRQWGFFLLEGVWATVSAWSLLGRRRRSAGG
jgi:membrane-bound ClpP family serine protease